ncbi:MAG: hypothetical protein U9Q74_16280 [Gemmatimonadota bacterium]|nr:hypothetical protein [Gemmatimonadota bacterium]
MPQPFAGRLRSSALLVLLVGATAGAQGGDPPLAPFAAQKLSVMPVQLLRADTASPLKPSEWATVRREIDDSIGTALSERGIGRKWAYAADIDRLAKRNASYVSDPYALGASGLRGRSLKPDDPAPPVLVNNLRSLVALGDSRFALVPAELSFEGHGADARAVLRVVLVDGRGGTVLFAIDVVVPAGSKFDAPHIGGLAQRVADLVVSRQ